MIRISVIYILLLFTGKALIAQINEKGLNYSNNGNIIFDADSLVFIFQSKEYFETANLKNEPLSNTDSVKTNLYYNLIDILKGAENKKYTLTSKMFYLGGMYFPNDYILKKLFVKKKIDIYRKEKETYYPIKYFCKTKRGRYVNKIFTVREKRTKRILFKTAYGGTKN